MMKLKYVGLKDSETAFRDQTGITWTPGASHEIEDELAARMLKHPDVFAIDVKAPPATPKPTAAPTLPPAAASAPPAITLAAGAAVPPNVIAPLANLDDVAVRQLAKNKGLKIQGIGLMKGANLRAKVDAALRAGA